MAKPLLSLSLALLASGSFLACGEDDPVDGGTPDSGVQADTGTGDTGTGDTGTGDTGTGDTGTGDTGVGDTGVDGGTDTGPRPQSIIFLHTNDEHSHHLGFAPELDDWPVPSTSPDIKGGLYRRAAVLDTLRTDAARLGSPTVLVGAGDLMMGSLFHLGNLFASPDYNMVDTVFQYNVLTLGNHEFDFGVNTLRSAISEGHLDPLSQTFSTLRVPTVVSNIRFSMTSPVDDLLSGYYSATGGADRPLRRTHVQTFGGVKVGFVGVMGIDAALVAPFKSPVTFSLAVDTNTTCNNDAMCPGSVCIPPANDPTSANGNCALDPSGASAAVNFPALIADIAAAVAEVRAQDVDLVVAVSHAGVSERELASLAQMGMGPENAVASEDIVLAKGVDMALTAANVAGIDLIIGGHSHTALEVPLVIPNPRSGMNTYIVQAGSYGRQVGQIRLTRPDVGGAWSIDASNTKLVPVDGTVDTTNLPPITELVIDGLLGQLIDGLEGQAIAAAGDGLIFPGEQCDTGPNGPTLPGNGNCSAVVPGATGGTLACHANRQLDMSSCTLANVVEEVCGDGNIEGTEQCDGASLPGTCAALGYDGGNLSCAANCTLNTSGCTPHFQSLLEIVLNFQRPQNDPPILHTPATPQGDLFFYQLGTTNFDVGETIANNESNLANLVSDANRIVSNAIVPEFVKDPIRVSVVANGVIRDGIYQGQTGALSLADLFRVLPLGVSPLENTPGYPLTDFYLAAPELKAALEVGVSAGLQADSFWLGVSGARVEYDLSLPAFDPTMPTTTGRITSIRLIAAGNDSAEDVQTAFEGTPLFANGNFRDPNELVHVSSDLYITLFATGFGICPRDQNGVPFTQCGPCTTSAECAPGSTCGPNGRCGGGTPPAFVARTFVPTAAVGIRQELKEFLALTTYVRQLEDSTLPANYNGAVPRRLCCVGNACPADNSRTCPPLPQ